jgi:hypothetical protein
VDSPWARALGNRVDELHPRIREYVQAIPVGSVGIGRGRFDVVGTPRRWLWPALALLARDGVLFPVWQHGVDFRVENRNDDGTLRARRTFAFRGGESVMVDAVSLDPDGLVDRLGRRATVLAHLVARVEAGALVLDSTSARVFGIPVPAALAPRLRLTERWDDATGRQHVALTLDAPLIGRLYEYAGSFTYEIREEAE